MTLRSQTDMAYTREHAALMHRVADHIAGAMANAHLNADLELQAARETALAEIGRVVNSTLDVDTVYEAVADELGRLISYSRLSISLLRPHGELERAFVRGIYREGVGVGTAAINNERRADGSILFQVGSHEAIGTSFDSVGLQPWAEAPLGTIDDPIGYRSRLHLIVESVR